MELCFVRHGQTDQNKLKKIQGQKDFPLNDVGRNEAYRLANWLKENDNKFDMILSSPLSRALETANIINEINHISDDVIINNAFIERCFGECEGLDVCDEVFVDILNDRAPGLEKTYELRQRIIGEIRNLYEKYNDKRILIVSHSHTIKALSTTCDLSYSFSDRLNNCSLSYFNVDEENIVINSFNVKTI